VVEPARSHLTEANDQREPIEVLVGTPPPRPLLLHRIVSLSWPPDPSIRGARTPETPSSCRPRLAKSAIGGTRRVPQEVNLRPKGALPLALPAFR